jgi:succinate dehydrogenase/fumarate reductase cytochrome b subunit
MPLDYIALLILTIVLALVVYGAVAVWGIPYEIAKTRSHPHQDAISAATWVSQRCSSFVRSKYLK